MAHSLLLFRVIVFFFFLGSWPNVDVLHNSILSSQTLSLQFLLHIPSQSNLIHFHGFHFHLYADDSYIYNLKPGLLTELQTYILYSTSVFGYFRFLQVHVQMGIYLSLSRTVLLWYSPILINSIWPSLRSWCHCSLLCFLYPHYPQEIFKCEIIYFISTDPIFI